MSSIVLEFEDTIKKIEKPKAYIDAIKNAVYSMIKSNVVNEKKIKAWFDNELALVKENEQEEYSKLSKRRDELREILSSTSIDTIDSVNDDLDRLLIKYVGKKSTNTNNNRIVGKSRLKSLLTQFSDI